MQVDADGPQVAHGAWHGTHWVLLETTKPVAHAIQLVVLQLRQLGWHVEHILVAESKDNPFKQPAQEAGADEKSK